MSQDFRGRARRRPSTASSGPFRSRRFGSGNPWMAAGAAGGDDRPLGPPRCLLAIAVSSTREVPQGLAVTTSRA